ncbi:MAG: hypothetical protein WC314_07275 [Vulcanimicrobiota bacterium]
MKVIVAGSDANAWACALKMKQAGHEVEIVTGGDGVATLLPGSPLSPEVASEFALGAVLKIVGRVGVSPQKKTVQLKLKEISGEVTPRDQERWPDFVRVMNNASEIWRGLFQEKLDVAGRWREFGRRQAMEVLRVPCQGLSELLDDWFESDLLKATLGATALRGCRQGPFAPGTAFLLLQRWARGEVFGRSKVGPGVLASQGEGIRIHDLAIESYSVALGRIESLRTIGGPELTADIFVSSEDPVTTLGKRVGLTRLELDTAATVSHWDARSTTAVARVAASEKWGGAMINFCSTLEDLEKAYDPTKYGGFSESPFAEFDSESGLLYVQHLGDEEAANKVSELCALHELGEVEELLLPAQIAERYNAQGGHLFGGERALWQSYGLRERLRRPFSNFYLCGAGTGPGDHGGASGLMCARCVRQPVATS